MRFLLITLSLSLFFASCTSISVTHDDFKDATIVRMDMKHSASIEGFAKSVYIYGGEYSRTIKNDKKLPATITFKMVGSLKVDKLTKDAYIKINKSIRKLQLEENNTEIDDDGTSSLYGKLKIPLEIEKSILSATILQYRLYAGNDPIEIEVSSSELKMVQKFLNTTGKEKK